MDQWLYVYGNGDFIYTILTSVNFFMNNAMSFFKVATVLSLLFFAVSVTGILPTQGYDWVRFIKVYVLVNLFVLMPYPGKTTVHDVLTNKDYVFNFNGSKLPFGLIFPVATISTLSYKLINLYQKNFSIDSNLNYSYSGMNFGANFIQGLDNVNSYDDRFNKNLDNYMQNCGFPLLYKQGKLGDLRKSTDIFATLAANTSASRFVQQVNFANGTPVIKACNVAIAEIEKYYNKNQKAFLAANAQMVGIGAGEAFTRYTKAANVAATDLLGISQGAAGALKQAIAMNMIMASLKNGAQSAGNGSLALAAYDAEQFQQYKKSGELSGAATARTIPILVGIGFALLFFLYPIMIFMAIVMGSYKAVGIFFQVVVTINLIPLIYEIINYISTFYLQKKLGVTLTGSGFNYDVSATLYSFTDNMIVAGNWLATSTPVIAWALVSGTAVALTQVFGHINEPATAIAGQTGNDLAHGNHNMGNVTIDNTSMNNMQSNKLDDHLAMKSGAPLMQDISAGGVHQNIGGQDYYQNHKSDLLANINYVQMASTGLQNSLSHSKQEMGQLSQQWGQQAQRLHDLSNSIRSGQDSSFSGGAEQTDALSHAATLSNKIQAGLQAVGSGGNISSNIQDKLNNDLKEYQKYSNKLSHSADQSIRDAYSAGDSLAMNSSKTLSETVATTEALNHINSNQSSINTNYNNAFVKDLRHKGLDPNGMDAMQQTAMAQEFVAEKINAEYGIKTGLISPSDNTAIINTIAYSRTNGNVNDSELDRPQANNTSIAVMGNPVYDRANQGIDHFKNDKSGIIVDQAVEQSKIALIAGGNILDGASRSADTINQAAINIAGDALVSVQTGIKDAQDNAVKLVKEKGVSMGPSGYGQIDVGKK